MTARDYWEFIFAVILIGGLLYLAYTVVRLIFLYIKNSTHREKTNNFFKTYIVDILILGGLLIFIYNIYFPIKGVGDYIPGTLQFNSYNYSKEFKFLGVVLVILGVYIGIRRYLRHRHK